MEDVKTGILKAKKVMVGILVMAVVVMAFTSVTLIPAVSAYAVPAQQTITSYAQDFVVNYDNVTIKLDGIKSSAIVGQVIQFYNESGEALGKVTLTGISDNNAGEIRYSYTNGRIGTSGMKTGDYNVTAEPNAMGCNATVVSLGETKMELKLKSGGNKIEKIPRGTPITVYFDTSLDDYDGVILEVIDPNDNKIPVNPTDNTLFGDSDLGYIVNVAHVRDMVIDTTGWDLGNWKFKVCTEVEYACGLDEKSDEVELEIKSSKLKIEAKKTEVAVSEKVKLTVNGVPGNTISIYVERGAEHAKFPANINNNPKQLTTGNYTSKIDPDGKMEYVIYFEKIGSYTVEVEDFNSTDIASVDISVSKKKVTFTMPETCAIGADLVVNGTANVGDTVDIAIDDIIVEVDADIDTKGKFEVKLPTPATPGTGTEGAIKIKAFIDGDFSKDEDVTGEDDDGSILVLMVTGDLTAESSATLVPPSDSFTLSGTASGSKVVDILIVAPKGGSGDGMNPTNSEANGLPRGVVYEAASVSSDFTWSVDIDVDEDADTGTYLVFVLSSGKNKEYDGIRTGELLDGIETKYLGGDRSRLAGKTQELINATLWDATIGTAGSDDFMKKITIKVGTAEVSLYSIADVEIGDDLVITGTSNREGHSIIVKVTGPVDLGTKFAPVENGKFKANFSTAEALTGEYTIEADDGEGHTDTTTVNVSTPVRTVASLTPTPSAAPVPTTSQEMPAATAPTSAQTAQLENSSTSPSSMVPGFEAVFVITALVAVYLFASKKKRK
jgi:hypothetical protein